MKVVLVVAVNFKIMKYDVIIGLEIHTELKTKSKMFCSCVNSSTESHVNKNVCPICLAHPGTLPKPNKQAIDYVLMTGLALNTKINRLSKFDRKNYFYPDLPKGYQISQFDLPFCYDGFLVIDKHKIGITRIHLEEDTAKLIHESGKDSTLIDFNRAGSPLMELVTEPVIKDAEEAKKFCQRFRQILRYLSVSDANMEKGEMRCEANISIQEVGKWKYENGLILPIDDYKLNNKVEVKNLNSFRSVEKAINFEIERQTRSLKNNEIILAETRGFDEKKGETFSQRKKESSADYRYFPEPDIPAIEIDETWLKKIYQALPEMPRDKFNRLKRQYNLNTDIAEILSGERELADWFEGVVSELGAWMKSTGESYDRQKSALAKTAANLITTEVLRYLNLNKKTIKDIPITQENFAELVCLIYRGKISSSAGQKVLEEMYTKSESPTKLVADLGLEQLDNQEDLEKAAKKVLEENTEQVAQYKSGKTNVIQFLLGKVMTETKGKANPKTVLEILNKLLS